MTTQTIDTTDLEQPAIQAITLPSKGKLNRDKLSEVQEIEPVTPSFSNDYAAALAFNEEMLDVMVHESSDPNAEIIVETWVNGVAQRFIRGQVQTVRRKYVEVLARAKRQGIMTKVVNDRDGNANTQIIKSSAVEYPFSVLRDDNPKGSPWLKSLMSQR